MRKTYNLKNHNIYVINFSYKIINTIQITINKKDFRFMVKDSKLFFSNM